MEARGIDVSALGKKLKQAQRVLASREGHKNVVAIVDEAIVAQGFGEESCQSLLDQF